MNCLSLPFFLFYSTKSALRCSMAVAGTPHHKILNVYLNSFTSFLVGFSLKALFIWPLLTKRLASAF